MRRLLKRKTRSTFFYSSLVIAILILIFSSLFIAKVFFPNILSQDEEIISPEVKTGKILDFEKKLSQNDISFNKIYVATSGAYLIAKLDNGPTVYFSNEKPVDLQVRSLHEVLTRFTIDGQSQKNNGGKEPKIIDFRFDKPVVRF